MISGLAIGRLRRRRRVRLREVDDVPAGSVLEARLPPQGVRDLARVPFDVLVGAIEQLLRRFRRAAEVPYRDDRLLVRVGDVHLEPDQLRVALVVRGRYDDRLAFLDLPDQLFLDRLHAAAGRHVLGLAQVHVEEAVHAFEELEYPEVVLVFRERVGHVDTDRVVLVHGCLPLGRRGPAGPCPSPPAQVSRLVSCLASNNAIPKWARRRKSGILAFPVRRPRKPFVAHAAPPRGPGRNGCDYSCTTYAMQSARARRCTCPCPAPATSWATRTCCRRSRPSTARASPTSSGSWRSTRARSAAAA